jgi:hypothetical protein
MVVPIHGGDPCFVDLLTAVRALQNSQTAVTAATGVLASVGTADGFCAAVRRRGGALRVRQMVLHCLLVPVQGGDACSADLLTTTRRALQNFQIAATAAAEVLGAGGSVSRILCST